MTTTSYNTSYSCNCNTRAILRVVSFVVPVDCASAAAGCAEVVATVGAVVAAADVDGAAVVDAAVVAGATVVGATVVGATVVGATVVGAAVVGAAVVMLVVGATVVTSVVMLSATVVFSTPLVWNRTLQVLIFLGEKNPVWLRGCRNRYRISERGSKVNC